MNACWSLNQLQHTVISNCKVVWTSKATFRFIGILRVGWLVWRTKVGMWRVVLIAIGVNDEITSISKYWSIIWITINDETLFDALMSCVFVKTEDECWLIITLPIISFPTQGSASSKQLVLLRLHQNHSSVHSIALLMEHLRVKTISACLIKQLQAFIAKPTHHQFFKFKDFFQI